MASKIRPDDWERLFTPNAPRRGGPLRTLINIVLAVVVLALLGAGGVWANGFRQQRAAQAIATATSAAATAIPQRTAAAQAELNATATLVAARAATAEAQAKPPLLTASVSNGGNVREQPISGQPIDQVQSGETVQLIGKTQDASWFRVTYTRDGKTITGWISRSLLTIDPNVENQVP